MAPVRWTLRAAANSVERGFMKKHRIHNGDDSAENDSSLLSRGQLERRVRAQPDNVFLLASLVNAYLEEGACARALEASNRAYALAPMNPLVLWDHARALYMNTRFDDAVKLHQKNLKRKVATIARHMHWPEEKAKQFQNASRFDLALCYIQLDRLSFAAETLRMCVAQARNGPSYYSPGLIRAKLRSVEKLLGQAERKSNRLWISLLEVRKLAGKRRTKYRRGFTTGLAMAQTRREAITKLRLAVVKLGYGLITAEDTEEFDRRLLKWELPDSIQGLAEQVRRDRVPRFTDFCMYPSK
jgi:tetratricopeptide (TPR) repeat protein